MQPIRVPGWRRHSPTAGVTRSPYICDTSSVKGGTQLPESFKLQDFGGGGVQRSTIVIFL